MHHDVRTTESHKVAASQVYRRKFCFFEIQFAQTASDESNPKRYIQVRKVQSSDYLCSDRSNSLGINPSSSGAIDYQPSNQFRADISLNGPRCGVGGVIAGIFRICACPA